MLIDLGMPLMALITFYGNLSLLGNKINVQMVICSSNLMHFPATDNESCDAFSVVGHPFDSDFLETFSELYCIHLLV